VNILNAKVASSPTKERKILKVPGGTRLTHVGEKAPRNFKRKVGKKRTNLILISRKKRGWRRLDRLAQTWGWLGVSNLKGGGGKKRGNKTQRYGPTRPSDSRGGGGRRAAWKPVNLRGSVCKGNGT